MNRWSDVWMQRLRLWVPAAIFVLLMAGLLFAYHLLITVRVNIQMSDLGKAQHQLAELHQKREHLDDLLARAKKAQGQIKRLYDDRFRTQATRLTRAMLRVKTLAHDAGLSTPAGITYGEAAVKDLPLVKKTFSFSVHGTYDNLRKFINFLELSESFLTLEEVRVSESENNSLSITLRLSTYFRAPSHVEEPKT